MTPIVDLGMKRGLKRYRDERFAFLSELGTQRCDLALSKFGTIKMYVVTAAPLVQEVLVERAADYTKSRALRRFARPLLGDGMISADNDLAKRHRKLLASAFQSRTIARYAPDMTALTQAMLAQWTVGEARDFAHDIMTLTVRIAAKTMFGDDDIPVDGIGEALEFANRWIMEQAASLIPLPLGVPTPRNMTMQRAVKTLDEIVYGVIAKKRERGGSGDILSTLIAAQDDETAGLTDVEVRDEVMTFFMAGHETTATALSWMFHVLAGHPRVCATLVAELDRVLAGRTPTPEDLDALPYLKQVTLETMRTYPPIYMIGRQACADTEIGGNAVTKNSYVLINTLGMHRREDYFPDPFEFRPERFADGAPAAAPRGGYIPFGAGPRVCIGNQFAMMETGLLAATIFQRLVPATTIDVTPDPLVTLRPMPGLPFAVQWR